VVVYGAVVLATLTGMLRAFREKYLPAWVVGLATALLLRLVDAVLGSPLGE
jgi:hypothetical protein